MTNDVGTEKEAVKNLPASAGEARSDTPKNPASPSISQQEPATDSKPKKTVGERWFGRGVFTLNWVVSFGVALYAGYQLLYTKKGKAAYDWMDTQFRKVFAPKVADEVSRANLTGIGGHIMALVIAPIMLTKGKIVTALNRRYGNPGDVEEAQERIAKEPKITLWGGLKARVAAAVAVIGSFNIAAHFFPDTFKAFSHEFGKLVCKVMGKPIPASKEIGQAVSKPYRIGEIAAWDIIATTAATALLLAWAPIMSSFSAKKHAHAPQPETKQPQKIVYPETVAATPPQEEKNTSAQPSFSSRAPAPAAAHVERAERDAQQGTGLSAV